MWGPRRARYDLLYHHHPPIAYETNGLPLTPLSLQGRGDLGIDVTWCGLSTHQGTCLLENHAIGGAVSHSGTIIDGLAVNLFRAIARRL
jgi:hypothetical protein